MKPNRTCPTCQTPLPPDAPQGLCPTCLLRTESASDTAPAPGRAPQTPPSIEDVARHFPQLEIVELLGQGGMGVVYKARQPRLNRWVALKLLLADPGRNPSFTERFGREAVALAKLAHPGIVTIHDFGSVGPFHYLLMEFVDGVSLQQMIRAGRPNPNEALGLVIQICEALQFAHDQGVVHRDIKPGNILVDRSGRVKIADFGLAKLLDASSPDPGLTADHHVMGTPHYMAPEQITHPLLVDHRADIYSLGVVFYEMLTGGLPMGRFQPPSQKVHIDVRLDEVVLRTLEEVPARRYQHARDVGTDVASIRPPSGTSPGATAQASPPPPQPPDAATPPPPQPTVAQGFARLVSVLLLVIHVLGLAAFFLGGETATNTGIRREVGYPKPWIHWETHFLDGTKGNGLGIDFPGTPWVILAVSLLAFLLRRHLVGRARPLRWTQAAAHLGLWAVLLAGAFAYVASPLLPSATGVLRETPSNLGHVSGGMRWSNYAFETPPNHRVTFRIEWLDHGRPVAMPGLEFHDTLTPARGGRLHGFASFLLQTEGMNRRTGTNQVDWQWSVRTRAVTSGLHGRVTDPFTGLSRTDSSYGHEPVRRLVPGQETTMLVVRGDAQKLEGDAWDPAMTGRAALELRVKVRLDPVPPADLPEAPKAVTLPAQSAATPGGA